MLTTTIKIRDKEWTQLTHTSIVQSRRKNVKPTVIW